MKITSTLHPDSIKKVLDDVVVIASDIDDTLIDAHRGLSAGVKKLGEYFGDELASSIYKMRQLTVTGFRKLPREPWPERDDFNKLMEEIKEHQHSFATQIGPKVWSRETWLTIAAKRLGIKLTNAEIAKARDIYWRAHTASAKLYADTESFLNFIKSKKIPLILMTASGSILKATKKGFHYDADYSAAYKKKNIDTFAIRYDQLLTGDPIDKPSPIFFDRVEESIKKVLGVKPEPHQVLAIGDSELNDLSEPKKRGWKTLLVKR